MRLQILSSQAVFWPWSKREEVASFTNPICQIAPLLDGGVSSPFGETSSARQDLTSHKLRASHLEDKGYGKDGGAATG
jgi:hypothetical protein